MRAKLVGAAVVAAMVCGWASGANAFYLNVYGSVTDVYGSAIDRGYVVGNKIELSIYPFFYYLQENKDGSHTASLTDTLFGGQFSSGGVDVSYDDSFFKFSEGAGVNGGIVGGDGQESAYIVAGKPTYYDGMATYTYIRGVKGSASAGSLGNYGDPDAVPGGISVSISKVVFNTDGLPGISFVALPSTAPLFGAALLALGAVGFGLRRVQAAEAA